MGSLNGRRALFPANYVEKISPYSAAPQSPAPNPVPPPGPSYSFPSPAMPAMPSYGSSPSPYNSNSISSQRNSSVSPSPYIARPSSRRGHSPAPSYSNNNSNTISPNVGPGSYASPYQSSPMSDQGGVKHAGYFTQQQQSSEPPPLPDASKKKNKYNDFGKRVSFFSFLLLCGFIEGPVDSLLIVLGRDGCCWWCRIWCRYVDPEFTALFRRI